MTNLYHYFKLILLLPLMAIAACSTNQATGRSQFTGLMPASQESQIGAQEHQSILAEYGGVVDDEQIRNYVSRVGQSLVPYTERKDVTYTFTVLDSPVVNAFSLPGGYVYITRGILALANNEAELAAVIGHEIGHVTARHSAERYSTSVVAGLGTNLLAAAINVDGVGQALGVGANLYLSSYSRSQEHEADGLGVRYISRAGYDSLGMADFLKSLEASAALEAKEMGAEDSGSAPSYFATHPVTAERVAQSSAAAAQYPSTGGKTNHFEYLRMVNGLVIGDSPAQGFVDQGLFVHPDIGFSFKIPDGYKTQNTPKAFVAQSPDKNGPTLVFNVGKKQPGQSIADYLRLSILQGDMSGARDFGTTISNGLNVASVEKTMVVNNVKSNVRVAAFEWDNDTVYQFMIAMPIGTSNGEVIKLQQAVFSFQRLQATQRNAFRPKTLQIRVANTGDTPESMSRGFPYDDGLNAERFRVINGISNGEALQAREAYKVIVQ